MSIEHTKPEDEKGNNVTPFHYTDADTGISYSGTITTDVNGNMTVNSNEDPIADEEE